MLDLVAYILELLPDPKINFVDVGAARGDVLHILQGKTRLRKPITSLGVDPVDFRGEPDYSHFVRGVISLLPETEVQFFVHEESSVSSLYHMITENVVFDQSLIDGINYYAPPSVQAVREIINVRSFRLETLLTQHMNEKEIIHFLKIDAQGADMDAFRSLGNWVKQCLFVQIETVVRTAKDRDTRLYAGQTTFAEDHEVLKTAGFRLLNLADFVVTPECDALYVNTALFDRLGLGDLILQSED